MNRFHTQDTISATVSEISNNELSTVLEEQGNSIFIGPSDVRQLQRALKNRSNIAKKITFKDQLYDVRAIVTHNQYSIPLRTKGKAKKVETDDSFWVNFPELEKSNESIRVDLYFVHPNGNSGKASHFLYRSDDQTENWRLAYLGNPTTLMNGHNSGPVKLYDRPGFRENMALHRLGFEFFFKFLDLKISSAVLENMKSGIIALQNTQFAIYVRSFLTDEDEIKLSQASDDEKLELWEAIKNRDLRSLKLMYDRPITSNVGAGKRIGEYLGLKPQTSPEDTMTGLMLKGYSGKSNPTFTINFYDKVLSNTNKKKQVNDKKLNDIMQQSLRVDITLHRRYIDLLAMRALTVVKDRISKGKTNKHYELFVKQMDKKKTSTALVMCIIMHVLPKAFGSKSFAAFLLKEILCDKLYMDKIVNVTDDRLNGVTSENVDEDTYKFFEIWKSCATADDWKIELNKLKSNLNWRGVEKLNKRKKNLEIIMGVSMDVPYPFWLQMLVLDSLYGLNDKETEDYYGYQSIDLDSNSLSKREKDEVATKLLRLVQKGKRGMRKERKDLSETFLKPLGM